MKQRAITESHNDPYQVNRNVWHSKTHTNLTMNPNKHQEHFRALEVAKDKIDKHRNLQTAAFQKGDHKEVEHHAKHLEMYKGVHDGILSGLAKAGHIHPKDAHRKSFKKLNESSDPATKHQINIAKKTLKMSDIGASLMGGMSKSDAAKLISKHHGVEHTKKLLKQSGHNDDEIKKLTENEAPQKPALNAPHQAKMNVTFQRLNAAHQKLRKATQDHSSAKSPGDRAKALKNLEDAKREHLKAKNDHEALKRLGESYSQFDLNLIFESFQVLDERENSEYEKRAYKAALKSKPENLKKGSDILQKNMKHHSVQANLHARKAHAIADKHQVDHYSQIKDPTDRAQALHHANKADYHIKKQTSHFHAHQGLKKAAQMRGVLKSESEVIDERKLLYLDSEHPAFKQGSQIAKSLNHAEKVKQLKNRVLRKHSEYSNMAKKHDDELKKMAMHKQSAEPRYAHHAHMSDHYSQLAKKYRAFAAGIDNNDSEGVEGVSESKDYHIVDTHTGEIVSSHKAIKKGLHTKPSSHILKKISDLNTKHFYEDPAKNHEGRYQLLHKDEYTHQAKLGLLPKK